MLTNPIRPSNPPCLDCAMACLARAALLVSATFGARSRLAERRDDGPYELAKSMEWTPVSDQNTEGESNGQSPLCVAAQEIISGLSKADLKRVTNDNAFYKLRGDFIKCHTEGKADGSKLQIETCSNADF